MEVTGLTVSVIALATLYSTCIECFDTFSRGTNLEKDLGHLLIRLDFEKTQLLLWGSSSGILKIDNGQRHELLADPRICKLVEDALEAIHELLSDASKLRQRYGVEQSVPTAVKGPISSADLLSSNSMSAFRTSWIRFCSRAARALPGRGASSTISRARWAIRDRSKFLELLDILSTFVEKLHRVIPVQDSQYADLESDLGAILDISHLRLVETALESSSNPKAKDLAKAASVIISESELGTIDRRSIVDWLQDTNLIDDPHHSDGLDQQTTRESRLKMTDRLGFLAGNTHRALYFVNTPGCWDLTASMQCADVSAKEILPTFFKNGFASLRSLFPKLSRTRNFHTSAYTDLFDVPLGADWDLQQHISQRLDSMFPLAVIYIHTGPCHLAIHTAAVLAAALQAGPLSAPIVKAVVRIDDRIFCSCSKSTAARIDVLQSTLAELDAQEPRPPVHWTYLDRMWLDQRLFLLEDDFDIHGDSSQVSDVLEIFSPENFPDPLAGLIIVGEVDFCTSLLQAEPLPWMPRFPRQSEVYEIVQRGAGYQRKYVGKLAPRDPPSVVKRPLAQRQAASLKQTSEASSLNLEDQEV